MLHKRPRTSRALIGLLVVVIILGLVFYLHNLTKSTATEAANAQKPVAMQTQTQPSPNASAVKPQNPAATPATAPPAPAPTTPAPLITNPLASAAQPNAMSPATPAAATVAPSTPAPAISQASLSDAQAKYKAGELIAARDILNTAIQFGNLSATDLAAAKKLGGEINQTVVFSSQRFADDPHGGTYTVQSGDRLSTIASKYNVTWELIARINNISDPTKLRAGATIKILQGPFTAVVDKSDFTLDLYLGPAGEKGSMYVCTYPVGLGRDDSTPTGTWMVEPSKKLKNPTYYSPRGEGIIAADDPQNPLGEYWIGLTGIDGHAVGKMSYGIHGTIDPDSIGKRSSMGCIRMHNEDVALVFEALVEGKSTVVVKD
jgi:lipoprotein-anchoring transpeptidase ErfK/SrfK